MNIISIIIRTTAIIFLFACLSYFTQACTTYNGTHVEPDTKTDQQGIACGFHEGVDRGQCGNGLECFQECTFECGEKYTEQPDGEYVYMLDGASVDRCAALGGTCADHLHVGINFCKVLP